jgi:NADPH:quinone reductase-like Zn-dependent oxidoreductase
VAIKAHGRILFWEGVSLWVLATRPGDAVCGQVPDGASAEYLVAPAETMVLKPANLSFEESAAVPCAVQITGIRCTMGRLVRRRGWRQDGGVTYEGARKTRSRPRRT